MLCLAIEYERVQRRCHRGSPALFLTSGTKEFRRVSIFRVPKRDPDLVSTPASNRYGYVLGAVSVVGRNRPRRKLHGKEAGSAVDVSGSLTDWVACEESPLRVGRCHPVISVILPEGRPEPSCETTHTGGIGIHRSLPYLHSPPHAWI